MGYCCNVWAGAFSCYLDMLGIAFVDFHLNWLSWFNFLIPMPNPLVIRLYAFSVIIPRFYADVYVNRIFPQTARLLHFLPVKCFDLCYRWL